MDQYTNDSGAEEDFSRLQRVQLGVLLRTVLDEVEDQTTLLRLPIPGIQVRYNYLRNNGAYSYSDLDVREDDQHIHHT